MTRAVLTLTAAIEEWLEAERVCVNKGITDYASLSRPQPMLHNLLGTLRVDVDFLGTNCNKKTVFNTASKRGAKMCPFSIQETVQKLQKQKDKTKKKKNPKRFSSNRYCLFTSHQNSLHRAACMKHFSLQTT